jgi:uncharacterized protein
VIKNGLWSPYLAGALTGIVMILSVLIADQYFGASTSFVRTAGIIESVFYPDRVAGMEYYQRVAPKLDWQWFFVVGILLGAFISAKTGGSFKWQSVPDMWHSRFGHTPVKRGLVAFAGGAILMFGARMADG